ncbi:MAG TPA: hypothetical protein VJ438_00500, partial [Candidatus Nanoarchaeia archaeon]|nr:hypothetical protein [Candidatus Nanoarchaeia archaeon]
NFVGIGWEKLGDLSLLADEEKIYDKLKKEYSDETMRATREIYKFYNIQERDIVLHYGNSTILNVGEVTEPYHYFSADNDPTELKGLVAHRIKVNWLFNGRSFEADFGKWRNTLHEVTFNDVDLIKDAELKKFLKDKLNIGAAKSSLTESLNKSKNVILYGPPGTGKTFKTKEKAVNIIFEIKAPIGDTPDDFKFIDEPGEMNYELVDNLDEIKGNITTFNQELENKDQKIISKLTQFTHWYYLESIDKFGPSKFIGYKLMTSEIYDKLYNNGLDGRDTEKKFKQISLPYKEASGDIKQKLIKLLRDYGHELKNNAVVNIIVE